MKSLFDELVDVEVSLEKARKRRMRGGSIFYRIQSTNRWLELLERRGDILLQMSENRKAARANTSMLNTKRTHSPVGA